MGRWYTRGITRTAQQPQGSVRDDFIAKIDTRLNG